MLKLASFPCRTKSFQLSSAASSSAAPSSLHSLVRSGSVRVPLLL